MQIENPVRVLPLHSFCAGLKQAALSMARHHYMVQNAIERGLEAAAAAATAADKPPAQQAMEGSGHGGRQSGGYGNGHCASFPPSPFAGGRV